MKVLAIAMLALCSGCVQILRFADGSAFYNPPRSDRQFSSPYKCTKLSYRDWFCAPSRVYGWGDNQSYDPIGDAWLTLFWPVSLVDIPCEVVFDTAMCVPDWILQR